MRRVLFLLAALPVLSVSAAHAQDPGYREIRFPVDQVTRPDVAVFPDNGDVLFTLLGHLFRVPAGGGQAEQLTAGPYFHKEPATSPDGSAVAFVSDRDSSGDNIFVLDLETGHIAQVTHEVEAGRPAWSPDGTHIAYLAYEEPRLIEPWPMWPPVPARVRTVNLASGEAQDATPEAATVWDVEFGPDGTLYWVRSEELERCWACSRSYIDRRVDGGVETAMTVEGLVDQLRIDGATGAFYYQAFREGHRRATVYRRDGPDGDESSVFEGDDQRFFLSPRFGLGPDGSVVNGDWGRLWRAEPRWGDRTPVPFRAEADLEVAVSPPPPAWPDPMDDETFPVRIVGDPVLSPDGSELLFTAAGMIWRKDMGDPDAEPERIDSEPAWHPAYAPDGGVVYVRANPDTIGELVVRRGDDAEPSVVARGRIFNPAWSADGREVVFAREWELVGVPPDGGEERVVAPRGGAWDYPSLAADGSWVAGYLARPNGGDHIARFPAGHPDQAAPLTDMAEQAKAARVSPDGRWLAFRRNADLWVADLATALADDSVVTTDEARLFAEGGGLGFSFEPSGKGLVFARGTRIFRASLPDGAPREIAGPVRVPRTTRPPLIIRNVRVLDPAGTSFSAAQDMYIDDGRIVALGNAPPGFDVEAADTVDAGGRFAIPGLWDSHLHGRWLLQMHDRLKYGITSLRDPGSPLVQAVQEHDLVRTGWAATPRRFTSGEIFEGLHDNYWSQFHRITTDEDAVRHVRLWKELGARFIKVYRSLPWPLQRAVAAEARTQGMPVVGHGMTVEEVVRSVVAGYRSLEHSPFPEVWHEDVLRLMAATGIYWAPQYVQGASVERVFTLRDPAWLDRLAADFDSPRLLSQGYTRNGSTGLAMAAWKLQAGWLQRAHELGVRMLVGTDGALDPAGLHIEMEALRDAGIPPADILRMATLEAAAAEGVDQWLSTLEVGKLADLVLLDASPLEDVRNARRPWRVILDGRVAHEREAP